MNEELKKEAEALIECYFIPDNKTTSATICMNCGKEKYTHTIGQGIKASTVIVITNP